MQEVMRLGQLGMQRGTERFAGAAAKLVDGPEPEAIVDSKIATAEVKAGAAVLRSADEALGRLIDDLA